MIKTEEGVHSTIAQICHLPIHVIHLLTRLPDYQVRASAGRRPVEYFCRFLFLFEEHGFSAKQ